MYRITDIAGLFAALSDHNFASQSCRLKVNVSDSFFPIQNNSYVIHFDHGYATIQTEGAPHDVELTIGIAELSSLLMGTVNLKSLVRFGLVHISNAWYTNILQKTFATEAKPICMTGF